MDSSTFESESDCSITHSDKKYKCPEPACKYSFDKPFKLDCHYRKHTNERPFVCDVENCNKAYAYSNHLLRHKNTAHSKEKKELINCTFVGCQFKLANKYSLSKHIRRRHNADRVYRYTCKECNKGFHKKSQLSRHKFEHTQEYPFECEKCGTGVLTLGALNRHKRTHTEYVCECGEKFERYHSYMKHTRTCTRSDKKCYICGKVLKIYFKEHMDAHLLGTVTVFKCYTCNGEFYYKKNLIAHIRKQHTPKERQVVKPRKKCTFPNCEKTFSRNQTLKHHIKITHSGIPVVKKPRMPRKDIGIPKGKVSLRLVGLSHFKMPKTTAEKTIHLEELLRKTLANCDNINAQTKGNDEQHLLQPSQPCSPQA